MAQYPDQHAFSTAYGGVRRTRHPQPPPIFAFVPVVLAVQSFRPLPQHMIHGGRPAYQYQNNYVQNFSPYEGTYSHGFNVNYNGFGGSCDSYDWNRVPPTRSDGGYQHQTTNLESHDGVWTMRRGGYVQEDESWILDGIGQESDRGYQYQTTNLETRDVRARGRGGYVQEDESWIVDGTGQETEETEDTMMLEDGCLSEEVVSKYLQIKNCHEIVATDKDGEPKICVVCQDNLQQEDSLRNENRTIGVLECGHEYHACCIKKWLQRKNVCPLCKAIALPVDGLQN